MVVWTGPLHLWQLHIQSCWFWLITMTRGRAQTWRETLTFESKGGELKITLCSSCGMVTQVWFRIVEHERSVQCVKNTPELKWKFKCQGLAFECFVRFTRKLKPVLLDTPVNQCWECGVATLPSLILKSEDPISIRLTKHSKVSDVVWHYISTYPTILQSQRPALFLRTASQNKVTLKIFCYVLSIYFLDNHFFFFKAYI